MRILLTCCMLLVVTAAWAAPETDATAQETAAATDAMTLDLTERLQQYLDATKTLQADFESVLLDEDRAELAMSSGEVFIKRPGKFRWEYRHPTPSLVLADGVKLWSYDEELEQAVARNLSDYRGANPTLLLGGDVKIQDSFIVNAAYRGGDIEWLELTPKDESSDFVKVRLGFEENKISLMELFDRLEQTTRILFKKIKLNPELDDKLFVFVPPENVDVIGDFERD